MVEKGPDGSNFVRCWDDRYISFGHFIMECMQVDLPFFESQRKTCPSSSDRLKGPSIQPCSSCLIHV